MQLRPTIVISEHFGCMMHLVTNAHYIIVIIWYTWKCTEMFQNYSQKALLTVAM